MGQTPSIDKQQLDELEKEVDNIEIEREPMSAALAIYHGIVPIEYKEKSKNVVFPPDFYVFTLVEDGDCVHVSPYLCQLVYLLSDESFVNQMKKLAKVGVRSYMQSGRDDRVKKLLDKFPSLKIHSQGDNLTETLLMKSEYEHTYLHCEGNVSTMVDTNEEGVKVEFVHGRGLIPEVYGSDVPIITEDYVTVNAGVYDIPYMFPVEFTEKEDRFLKSRLQSKIFKERKAIVLSDLISVLKRKNINFLFLISCRTYERFT